MLRPRRAPAGAAAAACRRSMERLEAAARHCRGAAKGPLTVAALLPEAPTLLPLQASLRAARGALERSRSAAARLEALVGSPAPAPRTPPVSPAPPPPLPPSPATPSSTLSDAETPSAAPSTRGAPALPAAAAAAMLARPTSASRARLPQGPREAAAAAPAPHSGSGPRPRSRLRPAAPPQQPSVRSLRRRARLLGVDPRRVLCCLEKTDLAQEIAEAQEGSMADGAVEMVLRRDGDPLGLSRRISTDSLRSVDGPRSSADCAVVGAMDEETAAGAAAAAAPRGGPAEGAAAAPRGPAAEEVGSRRSPRLLARERRQKRDSEDGEDEDTKEGTQDCQGGEERLWSPRTELQDVTEFGRHHLRISGDGSIS
ncbi:unnamed protein product [Prorocentrum cordatum]|nr:unnamed protein product [Polarella glacialis]